MNCSSKKTPILIIEDENSHYNAIERYFNRVSPDKYEFERFDEYRKDRLFNYKALKQDNQIAIVDLKLEGKSGESEDAGIEIIRECLWPADRTTFFVVFSQYIDKVGELRQDEVNPHWTFVEKKLSKKKKSLTVECLSKLHSVVEEFRRICPPTMQTPRFSTHFLLQHMERFLRSHSEENVQQRLSNIMSTSTMRSVDVLNDCANAASTFNRCGIQSRDLAIGVYGSCGRIEAREDSDIEYSVFYRDGDNPGENKQLAVVLWNRLMMFIRHCGWKVEGYGAIERNDPPILRVADVSTDLPNNYRPVISISRLLSEELQHQPQVRNRHLQIISEVRPIFNPELMYGIKHALIEKGVGQGDPSLRALIEGNYLNELLTQFFMDTRPDEIRDFKDYKRFCYRILHLLSLRLLVIYYTEFGGNDLMQGDERDSFFDSLADSGLHKIIFVSNEFEDKISDDEDGKSELMNLLFELVVRYVDILEQLADVATKRESGSGEEIVAQLKRPVKACGEKFLDVFKQIGDMRTTFARSRNIKWLLDTARYEGFIEGI